MVKFYKSIDKPIRRNIEVCPHHNIKLRMIYYGTYRGGRVQKLVNIFDEKRCPECLIRLDELEKMRVDKT